MTKSLTIIVFILFVNISFSQDKIDWMTWDEAIIQSEKDSIPKKVFLDLYTDWCGWCKRMDQTTFADTKVAQHINANYYPVKMDAEMRDTILYADNTFVNSNPDPNTPKRKGVHMLAYSLLEGSLSYPSYVVLDENKARITILKGFKSVDDLMASLTFFTQNQHLYYKQYLDGQNKKIQPTK